MILLVQEPQCLAWTSFVAAVQFTLNSCRQLEQLQLQLQFVALFALQIPGPNWSSALWHPFEFVVGCRLADLCIIRSRNSGLITYQPGHTFAKPVLLWLRQLCLRCALFWYTLIRGYYKFRADFVELTWTSHYLWILRNWVLGNRRQIWKQSFANWVFLERFSFRQNEFKYLSYLNCSIRSTILFSFHIKRNLPP